MQKKYLEAGEIVSTHGVQGEVKILPWADSPEFLLGFEQLYIDGEPYRVAHARDYTFKKRQSELEIGKLFHIFYSRATVRNKGRTVYKIYPVARAVRAESAAVQFNKAGHKPVIERFDYS